MRTSAFASFSLVIGSFAVALLTGCNHGTNVPPLHRPAPDRPVTPPPSKKVEKTEEPSAAEAKPVAAPAPVAASTPAPAPAPAPTPTEAAHPVEPVAVPSPEPAADPAPAPTPPPVATLPALTDGPWCHLSNEKGFFVTRWTFAKGKKASVHIEQLKINPDQPANLTMISAGDRWEQVTAERPTPASARTAVEILDAATVKSLPITEKQNDLMLELLASNGNVDQSDADEIGSRGGIRITIHDPLRAKREQIAFPCAEYSPDFVSVGAPARAAAAKPATPPAEPSVKTETPKSDAPKTEAPKVDPSLAVMAKVDPSALAKPFTPFMIERASLEGSRWCSWSKFKDDVLIGVLQFHADQKITLTEFFRSKLEADILDVLGLLYAVRGGAKAMSITGVTGSRFVTNEGRGFRMIEDANESRVLIADEAAPAAAPAPNADVFYPCVPALIPGHSPVLKRNLNSYMDLRDRRARE